MEKYLHYHFIPIEWNKIVHTKQFPRSFRLNEWKKAEEKIATTKNPKCQNKQLAISQKCSFCPKSAFWWNSTHTHSQFKQHRFMDNFHLNNKKKNFKKKPNERERKSIKLQRERETNGKMLFNCFNWQSFCFNLKFSINALRFWYQPTKRPEYRSRFVSSFNI